MSFNLICQFPVNSPLVAPCQLALKNIHSFSIKAISCFLLFIYFKNIFFCYECFINQILLSLAGSAWMALSKPFIDYCIWGWDNLPRTVLMYYANFISSPEGYFHTVICNAQEFRNTTVNTDLHFITWDNPPKQHPHHLNLADMQRMIGSNAPFARKFHKDDPVLDKIDSELLFKGPGMLVPGGWCTGRRENGSDPCSVIGNTTVLRPTPGAKRLELLISSLLSNENFRPKQCK